jgi:hypothetical protein
MPFETGQAAALQVAGEQRRVYFCRLNRRSSSQGRYWR